MVSRKLVNNFVETDDDAENCLKIKQKDSAIVDIPVGLINYSNDCFFNSVIQALVSLHSFRDHVKNFDEQTMDEQKMDAASSIKDLFRVLEEMRAKPDKLGLQGYVENEQFDAQ